MCTFDLRQLLKCQLSEENFSRKMKIYYLNVTKFRTQLNRIIIQTNF